MSQNPHSHPPATSDPATINPATLPPATLPPATTPPMTAAPPIRPGRTWPIGLLRVLSILILLQVLTQAALAGGFITGNVNLLGLHSANGITLTLTAGALLPAAIFLVRPGRGPWWPIVFAVVFWWLITLQVGFGFARQVGLHIPMGVAIMGLISGFTWWSCSYRGGGRRGEDRTRKAAA